MEDDLELMRDINSAVLYVRVYQALFAALGNDFSPAELHKMAVQCVLEQTGDRPFIPS